MCLRFNEVVLMGPHPVWLVLLQEEIRPWAHTDGLKTERSTRGKPRERPQRNTPCQHFALRLQVTRVVRK